MRDRELFADPERHVFHHRPMLISQVGESRIYVVIKNIALKQTNDFFSRVYSNGLSQLAKQIIDKNRQAGDVIHVRMRNNYVSHGAALRVGERQANAARVDCHLIVDQKTSEALSRCCPAGPVERTR